MPKNKGIGGKKRRKGKASISTSNDIVYKSDGQEYGQVTKSTGNGYMEVMCFESDGNVARRAHIRGKMRKRVWLAQGDIVLVNIRDFQDSMCDIVLKYSIADARILRSKRLLPDNVDINNKDSAASNDPFEFVENADGNDSRSDSDDKILRHVRNVDMPPSDSESYSDDEVDDKVSVFGVRTKSINGVDADESDTGSDSDSVDLDKLL